MWTQDKYADSRHITRRTVRRFQVLSDACGSLSLLSLVLVAGLAEPQPLPALLVALAGMGAALMSRVFTDCSTGAAPSGTESNPSRAAGTWATASHGTYRGNHSSRLIGIISGGDGR